MKPYKFQPYLRPMIWGGNQIAPFKGIVTEKTNIGESWEISSEPGRETVTVERGIMADADIGLTITQLIEKYKGLLVGERVYKKFGNKFPLLIKFIDSNQDLSVQVHPDDELAMKRHGCFGKTEMWYVLKAEVGAKIYSGLKRSITPDDYERLASTNPSNPLTPSSSNPFLDLIATHEAHSGDLYFLPAGRLHAIGAGNFLVEIQESSDITYRVYDFGRLDAQGKPRELHIQQAKEAIDYQAWPEYRTSYDTTKLNSELIRCPYFTVNRLIVNEAAEVDLHTDSFVVAVCLSGEANLNGVHVKQGETLLVPASENVLYIFGNATFLTATV